MLATAFTRLFNEMTGKLPGDLGAFAPELVLCATVLALLFGRLFGIDRRVPAFSIAMCGALIAFALALRSAVRIDTGLVAVPSTKGSLSEKESRKLSEDPAG